MDKTARLLSKIEEMIPKMAIELLQRPSAKDAFEYGRAVGLIEGVNRVKSELLAILNEDDNAKVRKGK